MMNNGMRWATVQKSGFTLVELLIVISILGILATVALPRYYVQSERGRVSEAIRMITAIREAEEAYRAEHGVYLEPIGDLRPQATALATTQLWRQLGLENPNVNAATRPWTYGVIKSGLGTIIRAWRNNADPSSQVKIVSGSNPPSVATTCIFFQLENKSYLTTDNGAGGANYNYCYPNVAHPLSP